MNPLAKAALPLAATLSLVIATAQGSIAGPPSPHLVFAGTQNYVSVGQAMTTYKLAVLNRAMFPPAMFAHAPNLPPCGLNHSASRTWIDVLTGGGKRLNRFCAIYAPKDLGYLSFSLPQGQPHPSPVYIVMTDRLTHQQYHSNLVTIP